MVTKFNIPNRQIDNNDRTTIAKLLGMVKAANPVIYELGTWTGESTSILAEFAKKVGGFVYTIDTFTGEGSDLYKTASQVDIEQIFKENIESLGLSAYVASYKINSNDIVNAVDDNSIDFMFVDGDHRYTQCKRDLDGWWPKIRFGGVFCGHDFESNEYNISHIDSDASGDRHHGVIKAVTEKFPYVTREGRIWWVIK